MTAPVPGGQPSGSPTFACCRAARAGRSSSGAARRLDIKSKPIRSASSACPCVGHLVRDIKADKQQHRRPAPQIMQRASLFRPGFVGAWTLGLLFPLMPGLLYGGLRLLATADGSRSPRVPAPRRARSDLRRLAAAGPSSTPIFQSPDESEHFGAAQYFAETGHADDCDQGSAGVVRSRGARRRRLRELSDVRAPQGKAALAEVRRDRGAPRRGLQPRRRLGANGGAFTRRPRSTRRCTTRRWRLATCSRTTRS